MNNSKRELYRAFQIPIPRFQGRNQMCSLFDILKTFVKRKMTRERTEVVPKKVSCTSH